MPLQDYLMPSEQIKYQSDVTVHYGNKQYSIVVTDKRLLLYAKRGLIFKNDDVISQKFDELLGVKYKESGIISKRGIIEVQGAKTKMELWGSALEIKALYQQIMQFM
jgi:hypothetical protein